MLISHRKRFIYTKTRKTAGTSVESYFERWCLPAGEWNFNHHRPEHVSDEGIIGYRGRDWGQAYWRSHLSAAIIRQRVGESIWNEYYKFCVIRNPFDRLVSAFHYTKILRKRQSEGEAAGKGRLKGLVENRLSTSITNQYDIFRFRKWVRSGNDRYDGDQYRIDGSLCLDYIVRYENLEGDLQSVCVELDIPFEPADLPHLKKSQRSNKLSLDAYYDQETIDHVSRRYAFEIEHFDYQPPNI
jgi:hypothetical protein